MIDVDQFRAALSLDGLTDLSILELLRCANVSLTSLAT